MTVVVHYDGKCAVGGAGNQATSGETRSIAVRGCVDMAAEPVQPVLESELLDVTGVDLARLADLPDTALRAALHRILVENDELPNRFAAFESSL